MVSPTIRKDSAILCCINNTDTYIFRYEKSNVRDDKLPTIRFIFIYTKSRGRLQYFSASTIANGRDNFSFMQKYTGKK